MTDAKGQDRNARIELSRPAAPRVELKKGVEAVVRQSFSHGRSKAVAVEVKRARPQAKPVGPGRPTGLDTGPSTGSPARPASPPVSPPPLARAVPPPITRAAPPLAPVPARPAPVAPPPPVPAVVPAAPPPPPVEPVQVAPAPVEPAPALAPPPPAPNVEAPPAVVAEAAQVADVPAALTVAATVSPPAGPVARPATPPLANPAPRPAATVAGGAPARPMGAPAAAPHARPTGPTPAGRSAPGGPSPTSGRPGGTAPGGGAGRGSGSPQRRSVVLKPLTEEEKAVRLKALSEARKVEEEARRRAEENARRAADESARRKAEEEASLKRKLEEESRKRAEDDARRKAEEQAKKLLEEEERREAERNRAAVPEAKAGEVEKPAAEVPRKPAKALLAEEAASEEDAARRGKLKGKPEKRPTLRKPDARDDKRTLRPVLLADGDVAEERVRSVAAYRRHMQRINRQQQTVGEAPAREVVLPETITVQELANRMAVRGAEVIKSLMKSGVLATINQLIDADTAEIVVGEFGHKVKRVSEADVEEGIEGRPDDPDALTARSPVVTVMGHVDHGKTSLLDALRSANVAAGEAGGITQHIGAYRVDIGQGLPVTFIDTPGHAAFTAMRARGASVTDIVVLVVAADDGVMPQTIEAIRHAKAASVPIVVAINKVDKPEADPDRVKTDLLSHEVVLEQFGGDVLSAEVSAIKRQGLDKLIEAIQLQAEVLDLKANPAREAQGTVVEAKLDRGRGVVATALIENGTLSVGDTVIAGAHWGRVRALVDDRGNNVEAAGPATPVEVLGLDGVPDAGDKITAVETEKQARDIAEYRQRKRRELSQVATNGAKTSLEEMFSQLKSGESKELPLVIKSDVHGSLEAIMAGLDKLKTDEVGARILLGGVGAVTESDVTLAMASRAVIIGFNVRANAQAREMAKREGIEIRYYSIIYELLDEVKGILSGMLKPEARESILGHAEIREVFNITKVGKIAGCMVTDGLFKRNARARLLRDNVVVFDGALGSLKRFKDDVREVKEGFECGMSIDNFNDIRQGDVIEAYEVEEVARTL